MRSVSPEQKQAEEGSVAWWSIHVRILGQSWLAGFVEGRAALSFLRISTNLQVKFMSWGRTQCRLKLVPNLGAEDQVGRSSNDI